MADIIKPTKRKLASSGTVTFVDDRDGGDGAQIFELFEGTLGPGAVDIGKLYAKTGYFTYDPGFMATASCQSRITYNDGEKGVLLYRGYPI